MKHLILLITLLITTLSNAQTELKLNDTISKEISSIKNHDYTLYLEDNQLAFLTLNQIGVDVAITSFGTDGKKIREFDSPNGRYGPEMIIINSTKKGLYKLQIASIDPKDIEGEYKLSVQKIIKKATTLFEQVDQVFLPWDNSNTPGAAVAIIKNGSVVYQNTYGSANLEYDLPITKKSVFMTGSVAKQFTAFSIMLLEQEGKLSLDDDIRKYIPEVPDFGHTITLKHLANHTSGFREEAVLAGMMGWLESDVVTTEQILKVISKQKALNFKPGEQYMYCNTGYTLLAEVVSRVSGQTFATYAKENIFDPLKMRNTEFFDDYQKIIKNKAYSYYPSGNGFKKSILNDANPGSSGLLTTIEDLSLWVLNFQNHKIGNAAIFKKMATKGVLNNGESTNYGLALERSTYKGLSEIGHGGAIGGFRARIATFPEQDFAVIVIANTSSIHPYHIPNQIVDIFLKDEFIPETNKKANIQPETSKVVKKEEPVDYASFESYVGKYYSDELSTEYEFFLKDSKLTLTHPRVPMSLTPVRKDVFIVDGWGAAEITFTRDIENIITGFSFSMVNTKNLMFSKK